MHKMYAAEVLGKLPVVQHFLFGSLLPPPDGVGKLAEGDEVVHHAGHSHVKTVGEVKGEMFGDCCGIPVPVRPCRPRVAVLGVSESDRCLSKIALAVGLRRRSRGPSGRAQDGRDPGAQRCSQRRRRPRAGRLRPTRAGKCDLMRLAARWLYGDRRASRETLMRRHLLKARRGHAQITRGGDSAVLGENETPTGYPAQSVQRSSQES